MTWLEFFSSLASSFAWPSVTAFALYHFKEPLVQAIPRLQRLKYKELEAEFDRGLEKIEQAAKEGGLEIEASTQVAEDFEEHLRQIAEISPNAAIVEAFRQIEQSAKALIRANGTQPDYKVAAPYRLIERILETTNMLGKREVKIFHDLRWLRNKVTHSESYVATRAQALEYIELASLLVSKIDDALAATSGDTH
ncbi:MAG: hypothetical protein R3D29_02535 [Nitratireductor sp.]